jgi:signal transduction histidine kinase
VWLFLFDRFLISENKILDGSIFIGVFFYGILLIRSVLAEVAQEDELKNLNKNLEVRVEEQIEKVRIAYEIEKEARIQLESLDKTKNQFILATQHHLRTPLTIIKGHIEILKTKDEETTLIQAAPQLQKIDAATTQLIKLVNELLNIAEYQLSKEILKKQKGSLFEIIKSCVEEVVGEIERKKIDCKIRFDAEAEKALVLIDKPRIQDALANLVDNGVKYTPDGGSLTIRGFIDLNKATKRNSFVIEVTDSGIGITPEEMEKVFSNPFERGKEAQKMNATGKGIGLLLTKNIINGHGGKVWVSSKGRGQGTTFSVELPME